MVRLNAKKMTEKLTNALVVGLKPADKRFWVADTKCPGLTVSVYPSGTKTYFYRYKLKGCRTNNSVKIGSAQVLSVSGAREAAACIIGDLARGIDPKAKEREAQDVERRAKQNVS